MGVHRAWIGRHYLSMAAGRQAKDHDGGYGVDALLASIPLLFLTYRLTDRFLQVASPDGGAHQDGWWRLAALGFAVVDVVTWRAIRGGRAWLKVRLLADTADVVCWSLAPYPHGALSNLAVIVTVPLAVEVGIRRHWIRLLLPLAAMGAMWAGRAAVGRPVAVVLVIWPVLAVGWGLLLRYYCQRLEGRSRRESELREAPERRRAFLAGQNEVAMGADSVVDIIEGVLPVFGPPGEGSVLWQLADAWKAKLAHATGGAASYLGQAVAEWAKHHNEHPDLSGLVQFQISEGVGTILLTGNQEQTLGRLLDELSLGGVVPLALQDPAAAQRPPGGALRLQVGTHQVMVPADPTRLPRPYDPGPAAFGITAFLMFLDMIVNPLHPVGAVAGIAMALACGWWAHRQLERRGAGARPAIMMAAAGLAVVYAAIADAELIKAVGPTGIVNYATATGVDLLGLLGGYYWADLPRTIRSLVPLSAVAVLAAAWLTHPLPQSLYELSLTLAWTVPLGLTAWRFDRELDVRARRYADTAGRRQRQAVDAAFRDGRDAVIDFAQAAAEEARQRLFALAPALAPRLVEHTAAKLEEVDRRLLSLSQPPQ